MTWNRRNDGRGEASRKGETDCGSRIADSKIPTRKSELGSRLGERRRERRDLTQRRKGAKRRMDREVERWGRHLPGSFSAEKCLDRVQARGRIKHVIEELTSESEFTSVPSGGPETGRTLIGQNLCQSSSVSRVFLYGKKQPVFIALCRLYSHCYVYFIEVGNCHGCQ